MRYLNDDVTIEAKRIARKMSIKQLANHMFNRAKLISDDYVPFTQISASDLLNENENAVYCVCENLLRLYPAILNDDKYRVRPYHCTTEVHDFGTDVGIPLGGFHQIGDLTFFGFFAGDAWDYALFMIIYCDGKNLRLYTPTRGNFVNTDYDTMLGREFDKADEETIKKFGMFGDEKYSLADIYVQKYEYDKMDLEKVGFNWDAIREDIMTTIKVV